MESIKEVAGYPPSKAALRLCSAARSSASLPTAGSSAPIDITGSPEEQLTYVTERLLEIGLAGKRAEDFTVLNKAVLLEVPQERELHLVAGPYPLLGVGGGRARIEPKYGFELLQDAARIRAVSELGPGHTQHQGKASIRQVMAEVIADHGLGAA
ncbi:hypothetical protein [Streptomyces avermitilis]|uniref:hypothetical protein n=1 Tax=Streptomyces avermitilis TaxID=33903 RepID=UPI003811A88A